MSSTNEKPAPPSVPLAGIPGIDEVSTPSEVRIVIESPLWATAAWCLLIVCVLIVLNAVVLGYFIRTSPNATWPWSVRSMLIPAFVVLPIVGFRLKLLAGAHTLIVTPEEIRSVWGRWTRTMKLTDCSGIRVFKIRSRTKWWTSFGLQILGRGWPIQIYGCGYDGDALRTANILRARLRYVMADLKKRDIERSYRSHST